MSVSQTVPFPTRPDLWLVVWTRFVQQKCRSTKVNPNRTLSELHCFHVFSCHPGIDSGGSLKLNEHIWCGISVSKSYFWDVLTNLVGYQPLIQKKSLEMNAGFGGIKLLYIHFCFFWRSFFLGVFVESSGLLDSSKWVSSIMKIHFLGRLEWHKLFGMSDLVGGC